MAFRFRNFTVEDEQSTLRVGTDAMLLGSWANPQKTARILDIGTGCGILALMMAQKSDAAIDAIDTDLPSVLEAERNFARSPWASRITAIHDSVHAFSQQAKGYYHYIITNPPYFTASLKSPSTRHNLTRHDESLTLAGLAEAVSLMLAEDGCFALILPSEQVEQCTWICSGHRLFLSRRMIVFPRQDLKNKRTLMEFIRCPKEEPECSELTILKKEGSFTPEYLQVTRDFHQF